jgi:arylsulfatase A
MERVYPPFMITPRTSLIVPSSILAGLANHGWAAEPPASTPTPRPNVVVLLADDLGYGDVGCYGATGIKTPNIDRLAAQGMRFSDAHAPSAVCQPSRYGLLAGRYYWRRKPFHKGYDFQEGEMTLPAALRNAGYATACFGKWHLGLGDGSPVAWENEIKPGPLEAGFDHFFGTPNSLNEPPFVFMEDRRVVEADAADPIRIVPSDQTVLGYGHGISLGGIKAHKARPMERADLLITDEAADYVRKQDGKRPFFIYLAFVAPHVPLAPSSRFQGTSQAGAYGDYVQQLDFCVGQVITALDERDLTSNTLIFLSSDNGACINLTAHRLGQRSNGSLLGQKTDAWDGGHRVPFIVRQPGVVPAGTTCDRLISLTDIMATSLAASGLAMPPGAGQDSLDQTAVLRDPQAPGVRSEMVYQAVLGFALRSGPWTYLPGRGSFGFTAHPVTPWNDWRVLGFINSDFDAAGKPLPEAPPAQLYDSVSDPGEAVNVWREHPEVVSRLDARLRELLPPGTLKRK